MNELFDIRGNVTVITGGTGVLGRAIAKYLAHNGAKVIILGRNEKVVQGMLSVHTGRRRGQGHLEPPGRCPRFRRCFW